MTLDEFEQLWIQLDNGIDGDSYLHLPLFGDNTATLDGGFTAGQLRQIADAIDKLKETWKEVEGKDDLRDWTESRRNRITSVTDGNWSDPATWSRE